MSFTDNNRPLFQKAIQIEDSYEHKRAQPMDARCLVDKIEDLYNAYNWGSYVTLTNQWSFKTFPGLIVGCLEDYAAYKLNKKLTSDDVDENKRLPSSVWEKVTTQEWVERQGYGTGSGSIDTTNLVTINGNQTITGAKTFSNSITTADSNLGCSLYRWLTISSSAGLATTEYTLSGINIKPYGEDTSFSVLLPTEAGTLATQQWVEAQGYGQNSGEIDLTNYVTQNDLQEALADYVKASISDETLILSTSNGTNVATFSAGINIDELLAEKADELIFKDGAITSIDIEGFSANTSLADVTLKEFLCKVFKILPYSQLAEPSINLNSSNSIKISNSNSVEVSCILSKNSCSDGASAGSFWYEGSQVPEVTIPANSVITLYAKDSMGNDISVVTQFLVEAYFKYNNIYSSSAHLQS